MISKTNLFKSNVSFVNKKHYLPKKEDYIFTKKITEIRNTPVSPSFGKRIIHVLTSLFHKLEIGFLIKDIKNNKLFDTVNINKHSNIFNKIDEKNIEIKNKNLNSINNIISHANDKFDFYSFCDYITEVKRAKDFFSGLDDIENECSDSKLIVEYLNEIIVNRITSINDKSMKNIFKLINSIFNFENIHLNKRYDFMSNFSTEKERENFIDCVNLLVIAEDELSILSNFDKTLSHRIKNNLSTILKVALGNNENASFKELSIDWTNTYINGYDIRKYRSVEVNTEGVDIKDNISVRQDTKDLNITGNQSVETNTDNLIIELNQAFTNDELQEIFGERELFSDENIEKENGSVGFDDTNNKEVMDDIGFLLSKEPIEDPDTLLSSLKSKFYVVSDYLNEMELKEEEIINLHEGFYSEFESYVNNINNIKSRLNDISEALSQIDFEEEDILKNIKSSSEFYHNIDSYKNEISQLFKEINKILDNENKDNFKSIKDTLNYDLEILNNSLKDIQVFNIEDKKTIINGLIKDLDKIILNSKNDYLDNEINRLSDIFKQKSRNSNIVAKPLSVNYESTPLVESEDIDITSQLHENNVDELNVDELFSSLENSVNEISSDMSDILNKVKSLSYNTTNGIVTNSELSKVQELKNKYINKKNMIIDSNNISKNKLNDKYIESTKKSKELQEQIHLLKGKLEESKARYSKENQQANENYISNLNVINEGSKRREKIKNNNTSIDANISNHDIKQSKEITGNKITLSEGNNKNSKQNNIANGRGVIDDNFEGELRTEHSIDIDSVNNIEIKDENIILIKDYKNKNKNIENVSFNISENRVTYLRVDYDNKKVAKSLKYIIGDEIIKENLKEIKEIKDVIFKLKAGRVIDSKSNKINKKKLDENNNQKEIEIQNRMLESKISEVKEKIKGDIKNIIDKINELSNNRY